jgi:Disulphide bond corrector protein DsbC
MAFRSIRVAILCSAGACGVGVAQVTDPTVEWVASWTAGAAIKQGGRATLELSGEVQDGWHVYALTQRSGGPTALRVTIDENAVAGLAGTPSGTTPESKHDPSFDLDTQFYTHSFAVLVPICVKPQADAGRQLIPVSVRFQTCSARECQPPKTIHLSVPVDVLPDT